VKPVLLVDVDGVITVFGPGIHDGPERSPLGGLDLALDKDLRPSEPAGRRPQQHLAGVRHHHL